MTSVEGRRERQMRRYCYCMCTMCIFYGPIYLCQSGTADISCCWIYIYIYIYIYIQGPICRVVGGGVQPPNDFLTLRVSVDLISWGVDSNPQFKCSRKYYIFDDFSLCCSRPVTLKYATNAFAAGSGSSRRSPRPPIRLGRGIPPPHTPPPRRLRRVDPLADPPVFFFYKSDTVYIYIYIYIYHLT